MQTIEQDILSSDSEVIVHQTNCVSTYALGLAHAIQKAYPYANVYSERKDTTADDPGTVKLSYPKSGQKGPIIANFMAQYFPGKPLGYKSTIDSSEKREEWFQDCLDIFGEWCVENNIKSVSFPYRIGCGLAGGDWSRYETMIRNFSHKYKNINITICKLKSDSQS